MNKDHEILDSIKNNKEDQDNNKEIQKKVAKFMIDELSKNLNKENREKYIKEKYKLFGIKK